MAENGTIEAMSFFVKDKTFYRQLIAITIPIAMQNLINFGISMSDTVMLGMLGEVQLSAASIANQLGFIYMLLGFGTGSGAVVLIAQFWGKQDIASIHKSLTAMYRTIVVAALFFTSAAMLFPREIVSIFTTDALVIEEAAVYLRIVGMSYLFSGLASTTMIALRAVRIVKISVIMYSCSLVISVAGNWLLIFGNLGAPALGTKGAAITTCIARVVEFIIAMTYLFFFEKKIQYKFRMLFAKRLDILRSFMQNAAPVVLNELLWSGGISAVAVVIGRMGREFVAANAICSVLSQLVMVLLFGVANAAAVIVGNTVGEGNYKRAKEYAHTFTALSLLLGLISCAAVLLIKGPIISLYNISDLARTYADQIITIYSIIVVFASVNCTILIGSLRGGGDTRFVLLIDVFFLWVISIPLGFLTGLYLGWPVWAVYAILKSDEVFKCIAALIRLYCSKWINDITRGSSDGSSGERIENGE